MTTLFTQLSEDLEQIIAGVEMRRHARRNWMERLMLSEGSRSSSVVRPGQKKGVRCRKVKQVEVHTQSGGKCH